jgi:hypothetical protein
MALQKVAWLGTHEDSGAEWTLNHHSLNPYMEDMEWLGSIIFCLIPPNSITFARILRQSAKCFTNGTSKSGMAGHR